MSKAMEKWFICKDEDVSGPFTTESLRESFANGELAQALVWGRLASEWMSAADWHNGLDTLLNQQNKQQKRPQLWHYAYLGESYGPMPRADLIAALSEIDTKKEVLIWTKGMKSWAELFHFQDIIEDLGINRRQYPRARISGSVVLRSGEKVAIGQLATIGVGGFGATQLDDTIVPGSTISAEIKSAEFSDTINVRAIVQYISEDGFVGFKFDRIHKEAEHLITGFVNKAIAPKKAA